MQKSFPIWGTCLGFETLLMLTRRSTGILDNCRGYNFATELTFMPGRTWVSKFPSRHQRCFYLQLDANDSRLLGPSLPSNIRNALVNEPTTANFHNYCMRPQVNTFCCATLFSSTVCLKNFTSDPVLSTFYKMLTVSPDIEGKTFVSTIEGKSSSIHPIDPSIFIFSSSLSHLWCSMASRKKWFWMASE